MDITENGSVTSASVDEALDGALATGHHVDIGSLSKEQLRNQLAECQADKEFVWSLWRGLQSSAPDKTHLIGLVVTREKEKANQKVQQMHEAVEKCKEDIADMMQMVAVQKQEVQAAGAREAEMKRKLAAVQDQLSCAAEVSSNSAHHDVVRQQLGAQLQDVTEQNEALRSQVIQATTHSQLLAAQLQEQVRCGKQQADEIVTQRLTVQKMSKEISLTTESRSALESHCERVVSDGVAKLEACEAELTTTRMKLKQVSEERKTFHEKMSRLKAECKQLKSVLHASAASHVKEKDHLKQALSEQQQRSTHDQKHLHHLRDRLARMQAEQEQLQSLRTTPAIGTGVDRGNAAHADAASTDRLPVGDQRSIGPVQNNGSSGDEAMLPELLNAGRHVGLSTICVATQTTDRLPCDTGQVGAVQGEELAALRNAHARRLHRFQHLLEDHRLLQQQLQTYERGSGDANGPPLNAPSMLTSEDEVTQLAGADPWYLQQEDLHGVAPWNELTQIRKVATDLRRRLDIAEEERDQLLVHNAQLGSELQEKRLLVQNAALLRHTSPRTPAPGDHAPGSAPKPANGTVKSHSTCEHARNRKSDASTCTDICGHLAEEYHQSLDRMPQLLAKVETHAKLIQVAHTQLRSEQANGAALQAAVSELEAKLFMKEQLASYGNAADARPSAGKSIAPTSNTSTQREHDTVTTNAVTTSPVRHKAMQDASFSANGSMSRDMQITRSSQTDGSSRRKTCADDEHQRGRVGTATVSGRRRAKSLPPSSVSDPGLSNTHPQAMSNWRAPSQRSRHRTQCSRCMQACKVGSLGDLDRAAAEPTSCASSSVVAFGRRFKPRHADDDESSGHRAPRAMVDGGRRKRSKSLSAANSQARSAWRAAALKRETTALRDTCNSLREEKGTWQKRCEELQRQLMSCQAKLATAQATNKLLQDQRAADHPIGVYNVHRQSIRPSTAGPTCHCQGNGDDDRLVLAVSQLKQKTEKERNLTKDVSRQLTTIRRLRIENEGQSHDLEQLRGKHAAVERDLRQKQMLLKSIRDSQMEAHRTSNHATTELRSAQERVKSKQEEITLLKNKVAVLQKRMASECQEKEDVQSRLKCSFLDLKNMQTELQRSKQKLRDSQRSAADSQIALESLSTEGKEAEVAYQRSLSTLELAVQSSRTQLEEYKKLFELAVKGSAAKQHEVWCTPAEHESAPDVKVGHEGVKGLGNAGTTGDVIPAGATRITANASDENKTRSCAWMKACQLSCSILELSASELSDLLHERDS